MGCMELKSKLGYRFQKPSGSKLFQLLKCERNHNLASQSKRQGTSFLCGLTNQAWHMAHAVAECTCSLQLMCPEELGTTTNPSVWRRLTAAHTSSPENAGANLTKLETPSGWTLWGGPRACRVSQVLQGSLSKSRWEGKGIHCSQRPSVLHVTGICVYWTQTKGTVQREWSSSALQDQSPDFYLWSTRFLPQTSDGMAGGSWQKCLYHLFLIKKK